LVILIDFFVQTDIQNIHVLKLKRVKNFRCDKCDGNRAFYDQQSLEKHIAKKHDKAICLKNKRTRKLEPRYKVSFFNIFFIYLNLNDLSNKPEIIGKIQLILINIFNNLIYFSAIGPGVNMWLCFPIQSEFTEWDTLAKNPSNAIGPTVNLVLLGNMN